MNNLLLAHRIYLNHFFTSCYLTPGPSVKWSSVNCAVVEIIMADPSPNPTSIYSICNQECENASSSQILLSEIRSVVDMFECGRHVWDKCTYIEIQCGYRPFRPLNPCWPYITRMLVLYPTHWGDYLQNYLQTCMSSASGRKRDHLEKTHVVIDWTSHRQHL